MIQIPYRLDFTEVFGQFQPGAGAAGWTVATFEDREAALIFLRCLPGVAWMPGTERVADQLGVR